MEFFAKIVNGLYQLTILAKPYILYTDRVLNGLLSDILQNTVRDNQNLT